MSVDFGVGGLGNGIHEDTFEIAQRTFLHLVEGAIHLLDKRRYLAAAVSGSLAARSAWFQHPGLFTSRRLEGVLLEIGRKCVRNHGSIASAMTKRYGAVHVLTTASPVAGDTRFVWRWMRLDPSIKHSVVITRQRGRPVPLDLKLAALASGGDVHLLDANSRDLLSQAALLRGLAMGAHGVFVHTYPDDPLPLLAFADPDKLPRIALVNQSDHTFWLGGSVADLTVELRQAGKQLSSACRGIPESRIAFLPIPVTGTPQVGDRHLAKKRLGLQGSRVVLSIAVGFKFAPIVQPTFQSLTEEVLGADSSFVFIVIGPRADEDSWKSLSERFGNRLRLTGPTSDTEQYLDAADVFVDSYPFGSNTSLLEAGIRGLPLVSFSPHRDYAEVLCGGGYGLDKVLIREAEIQGCVARIGDLLVNEEKRQVVGARTRETILDLHGTKHWLSAVGAVYRRLASVEPLGRRENDVRQEEEMRDSKLSNLLRSLYRLSGASVSMNSEASFLVRPLVLRDRYAVVKLMRHLDPTCSRDLVLPDMVARGLRWLQSRQGKYGRKQL